MWKDCCSFTGNKQKAIDFSNNVYMQYVIGIDYIVYLVYFMKYETLHLRTTQQTQNVHLMFLFGYFLGTK